MTKKKTIKLYVVRHGKTYFNATDRIQGVSDAPLMPSGIEEIRAVGREFASRGWKIDQTFHSPLARAKETVELLRDEMGLNKRKGKIYPRKAIPAPGTEEWNFGSYEGKDNGIELFTQLLPRVAGKDNLADMTCEEIANAFHEIDTFKFSPTWDELKERILKGFEDVARELHSDEQGFRGHNGLIVSHGMTMLALYYILTGVTLYPGSIKNGGLLELEWDGDKFTAIALEPAIV